MKKILMLLSFICFLPFAHAEEQQQAPAESSFWTCHQVGIVEKQNVFLVSDVHYSNGSYDKHVKMFENTVKHRNKAILSVFKPVFEPSCISTDSMKKMQVRLFKNIKKAQKRNFKVIKIKLTTKD